ncbi:ABC transporter permease [Aerococcus kribbianus]|uniref:ABC transporter permease n=1 Tax=Aerococcus kribbianus TaxID=2999064 RepID=A0A9X3FMZ1_9LACT|nr:MULTISPECIES: ABC transporter permease [unclassified Aerococcus]MCZ0717450.1 ABC transporter permease [Aerococcus sp. YH-aer221]MCZ0725738.1 ABC transporter permease [Aerococcus sp. YH-aer222]
MYRPLIINDLKASKLSSATILFFILMASFFASLVTLSGCQLLGAIDHLMVDAQAPHFIQMHLGDVDFDRLDHFANNHHSVASYQVQNFVNVDSHDLLINGQDWTNHSQDNGFSSQNANFDFLLDLNNQKPQVAPGQVYLPLSYYLNEGLEKGDLLSVNGLELEIQGPIRDVQMNSSLSSSKRFLVHPQDLAIIQEKGQTEYLIEFLLNDLDDLSTFQGDYSQHQLENNGPTITYPLIRLINGLTEGIMLLLLATIGFITLLISFLCIRFTLLARLEEDQQQIAILRAIGLPFTQVKNLYISKYLVISLVANLLGFGLALGLSPLILDRISLYYGTPNRPIIAYLLSCLASLLVTVFVIGYSHHLLNRYGKMTPAQLFNLRKQLGNKKIIKISLTSPLVSTSQGYLAWVNLANRLKSYFTLTLILIMISFITLFPQRLASSIESREFIQYMGIGDVDIMLSIPSDLTAIDQENMIATLDDDPRIEAYNFQAQATYSFQLSDGQSSKLWLRHGNPQTFPINYQAGHPPQATRDIALSYLLAKELDKTIGDTLTLQLTDGQVTLTIVGIYSDITNGGRTGQTLEQAWQAPALKTNLYITSQADTNLNKLLEDLSSQYPDFQVISVNAYRQEVLGDTANNLNKLAKSSRLVAMILLLLVTILFNHLMVIKDRIPNANLKALGIPNNEVVYKYYFGMALVTSLSLFISFLLNQQLGERLVSVFMQALGIGRFYFVDTEWWVWFLQISVLVVWVMLATALSVRSIKTMPIAKYMKE